MYEQGRQHDRLWCAGEWLCWPCRVHEENLRAAGVPQKDIRPPRWELHSSPEGRKILEGGSLAAECALCPVRQGAFRQTVDTHQWVHQVSMPWDPWSWVLDNLEAFDGWTAGPVLASEHLQGGCC